MLVLPAALLLAGCGADRTRTVTEPAAPPPPKHRARPELSARCPRDATDCRSVRGLVIYVQAVDPDGDGDAHIAVADRRSLTYPGVAVIKLTREMRPSRLPRQADQVAAAGPIQRSSDGSPEIRASVLHVRRR